MILFKISSFLLLVLLLSGSSCTIQTSDKIVEQKVKNLTAFSRVYGYVRYFHPSDEAQKIDWDKLAVLGVKSIKKANTDEELKNALESLFFPIAPTITFTETEPSSNSFLSKYLEQISEDTTKLKTVAWQYLGINLKESYQASQVYASNRTNRHYNAEKSSKFLFQRYPSVGETTIRSLVDGLWCEVPLALYSNETHTLPRSSQTDFNRLKKQVESINLTDASANDENVRLADTIIAWNELQHFYPYFDVIDTNWEIQLSLSLKKALTDRTQEDFYATLSSMLASTRDGHIQLNHPSTSNEASLPFLVDLIENKVVVTHSIYNEIQPGDIVTSLNGESAMRIVQDQINLVSGSPQLSLFRSLRQLGVGKSGTHAVVEIQREKSVKSYTIPRSSRRSNSIMEKSHLPVTGQIEDSIYYVDLTRASMTRINDEMDQIASSPGVIFDMRGYPNRNHQIIRHILTRPDTSNQWMKIPKIIYPDQRNIVGYQKHGWHLTPATPHIQGEVVFITDARAISYAESFMSFIEHYDLGEIVGQPTAGTNGNVNITELPGGYRFGWTGMKVVKHDGSQHHLVGIQPTIPIKKTMEGIREGKDEFLEKAIQVLHQ